ncbi:MAG: hypothetical protein VYE73_16245 [Acidobacteriota bacterium]|nr:hypothetical protein [Acidobacteriota bacterium]
MLISSPIPRLSQAKSRAARALTTGLCLLASPGCVGPDGAPTATEFTIEFDGSVLESLGETVSGRLILALAEDDSREPRFQTGFGLDSAAIFGIEVDEHDPSQPLVIDGAAFGYPRPTTAELPEGRYYAQATLHVYDTFELSTGHTVKLPMDRGEGQQWNRSPGNVYSLPVSVQVGPGSSHRLTVDQVIAPIAPPQDTDLVKHVTVHSDLLTEFWGRPMHLGAHVLVPHEWAEHPEARFPLAIFHGHFPSDFGGIRTTPPDPDLEPDYSARFGVSGYNRIQQEEAWRFYQTWTSADFPRILIVEIQHPTPYYDDSYAVNSASMGPWGDAIMHELIPHIEKEFRGIGEGWARFTYGGSTGGWEAMAAQVFYPDDINGAFIACPDPIDFTSYMTVNLYEDDNAYFYPSRLKRTLRPAHRNYLGDVDATIRDMAYMELVKGRKGRSGDQLDIWQAVYSPQGEDGYPKPIWNKITGEIDKEVAQYWRENYDLRYILERDWETLGPKLEGKLHIYCGDMDNYYLNNAVYSTERFLEGTTSPYYAGVVDYGDRAEHCWNGDHENGNHISRLRYNTMYVPRILERIRETAPAGADTKSWRY